MNEQYLRELTKKSKKYIKMETTLQWEFPEEQACLKYVDKIMPKSHKELIEKMKTAAKNGQNECILFCDDLSKYNANFLVSSDQFKDQYAKIIKCKIDLVLLDFFGQNSYYTYIRIFKSVHEYKEYLKDHEIHLNHSKPDPRFYIVIKISWN